MIRFNIGVQHLYRGGLRRSEMYTENIIKAGKE